MSDQNKTESYEGLFSLLAFAILAAIVLLAIGGVYYTFINPGF